MATEKFEYTRLPSSTINVDIMNELGEDGWEFIEQDQEGYYVFKRSKKINESKEILHG